MKSEMNMRKSEKVMPKGKASGGSPKNAPHGRSKSVGKTKNPSMGLGGLHAAGGTIPLFNAPRVDALEGKSPKNKSRSK